MTSTTNQHVHIPCPHRGCPYAFPQIPGFQSQIRQHLTTLHSSEQNKNLNKTTLNKLHCFPCPHCPLIFATVAKQNTHMTKAHATTREQSNIDLVLLTYPGTTTKDKQHHITTWNNSLQWLQTLHITPPTARTSLYTKLAHKQKQLFFHTLHHIVTWCNKATVPVTNTLELPPYQNTATPFWKLLLIFESTILAPAPKESHTVSYSTLLKQRMTLFRLGQIQKLYDQSRPTQSTPLPPSTPPIFNDLRYNRHAQQCADQDNLHTAYARISSIMPTASLTPHYLNILKKLYPPPISYLGPTTNSHNTRQKIHNRLSAANTSTKHNH
jgi:hypothetical protein